jgi:tellurite resistance protein TerC
MHHMPGPTDEHSRPWNRTVRAARRAGIALIGSTVVLAGLAMLVLPGPGLIVIPAGLAILGIEFAWVRHWMKRAREYAELLARTCRGGRSAGD